MLYRTRHYIPFKLLPDPSTLSESAEKPLVGRGIAECLWCFLLEGFDDDPVAEDENGDIKPVFLMVELNEPITASTCIILDMFG